MVRFTSNFATDVDRNSIQMSFQGETDFITCSVKNQN